MSDSNDNTLPPPPTASAAGGDSAATATGAGKKKKNKSKANKNAAAAAAAAAPTATTGSATASAALVAAASGADAASDAVALSSSPDATATSATVVAPTDDDLRNVKSLVEQLKLNPSLLPLLRSAKTPEEALTKSFKFWSTQPVPKLDEKIAVNEHIEPDKDIADIRADPYRLPAAFKWDTLNLNDPLQLTELYTLLNENYVEDDDAMFRFDYQPEFLKWALQPPGWRQDWHVGVRVEKSGLLVGFISAIPGQVKIYDKVERIVEINFLCVHKKLRAKRVAPVLISEITRRVNLTGIFQAVYTAGVVLPKPVSTCRYWHRSLNPKKLIEIKFSHLSRNMTMQRTIKLYRLPDTPRTPGFRAITDRDMPEAHRLLATYLQSFWLTPVFDEAEFRHWFSPQNGIICAYVVECPRTGAITDMVSYYTLPSTVMHHAVHKCVKAAYSFYNVSTRTPWVELMNDALIAAKNDQFDVFNALDLMENQKFLTELKFGIGDGNLQYYLYNWRCPSMQPEQMGLILL